MQVGSSCRAKQFLSTPSARRATDDADVTYNFDAISIHALREEGDHLRFLALGSFLHFYPRPPRGGRQRMLYFFRSFFKFLSTPSARRATHMRGMAADIIVFLSTPSARRATNCGSFWTANVRYFYPRPPRGGRPALQRGSFSL